MSTAFKVIALLAIIVAVIALIKPTEVITPQELSTLDEIRSRGRINVCYVNYPPFNIKDPGTGGVSGVYIEALELIAEKMGVGLNFEESTWGTIVPDLTMKRCDVNTAAVFPLIERAYGGVIFSRPLGYIGNNGVVKKGDTRFAVIGDLNREDITIAVVEGEQGHIYAKKYLPKANLHVMSSADISLAIVEVIADRADVGLADSWTIEQYLKANPDTNVERLFEEPYTWTAFTWAVKEGDQDWLNFLNNALGVLEANGGLDEIMKKYDVHIQRPKIIWEST